MRAFDLCPRDDPNSEGAVEDPALVDDDAWARVEELASDCERTSAEEKDAPPAANDLTKTSAASTRWIEV